MKDKKDKLLWAILMIIIGIIILIWPAIIAYVIGIVLIVKGLIDVFS